MDDLQEAMRNWSREVEREAVKLINGGTPPFEAVIQARQIVSRRRSGGYCDCPKYDTDRRGGLSQ